MIIVHLFLRRARRLVSRRLDVRKLVIAGALAVTSVGLSAITASADSHDGHAKRPAVRHEAADREATRHGPPGIDQRNVTRSHVADSFRGRGLPMFIGGPLRQAEGAAASQVATDAVLDPNSTSSIAQRNAAGANATNAAEAISPTKGASSFAGVAISDSITQAAGASVAQGGVNVVASPTNLGASQSISQKNDVAANAGNVVRQRFLFLGQTDLPAGPVTVTIDNQVTQIASAVASQSAVNVVDSPVNGAGRTTQRIAQASTAVATVQNRLTQVFIFVRTGVGQAASAASPLDLVVRNTVLQSGSASVTQVAANAVVAPVNSVGGSGHRVQSSTQVNRAIATTRNRLQQLFVFDLTGSRPSGAVVFSNQVSQAAGLGLAQQASAVLSGVTNGGGGRWHRRRATQEISQTNVARATVVNEIVQVFIFVLP